MDLKETDILGANISNHWYYRSKANAMTRLISAVPTSVVLDVGAGSGFFSKHLVTNTSAKEAWCVDISYDEDSDIMEAGKPVHFRRSIDDINADLVLLMDVLEHVDDDVGLLAEYVQKVPRGTRFLISVPAFKFLWSGHDVFLDHRRRYRLKQMENVVKQAGLTVTHGTYYFGGIFPLAATIRLVTNLVRRGQYEPKSQLTRHSRLVNGILGGISYAELPFLRFNRLFGLSVFCLAEKK